MLMKFKKPAWVGCSVTFPCLDSSSKRQPYAPLRFAAGSRKVAFRFGSDSRRKALLILAALSTK